MSSHTTQPQDPKTPTSATRTRTIPIFSPDDLSGPATTTQKGQQGATTDFRKVLFPKTSTKRPRTSDRIQQADQPDHDMEGPDRPTTKTFAPPTGAFNFDPRDEFIKHLQKQIDDLTAQNAALTAKVSEMALLVGATAKTSSRIEAKLGSALKTTQQ